ncbi:MAG: 50S ribosomal protein L25/general stress protein Ctc, partial [Acidimicrobiales bacterium]
MPEIVLQAESGRPRGSSAARRLRREGKIPGVVYGHGTEPVSVAVVGRELRLALSGDAGTNALLSLEADGNTYLTVARELQRHPVRGTVTHVDF